MNSFNISSVGVPAAGTPRAGAPSAQCRASFPKPTPVVVNVRCARSSDGKLFRLFAQQSLGAKGTDDKQGYLRLRYGDGSVQREIDLDVRSQSIQLPPCTSVQAEFRRFNETGTATGSLVDVQVSLSAGLLGGDPIMPTSTTQIIGPAASETIDTPNSAKFWQLRVLATLPLDIVLTSPGSGFFVDCNVPTQFPSHPLWTTPIDPTLFIGFAGADVAVPAKGYLAEFFIQP